MDNNEMLEQIKRAADELKRRREQINNLLESFDNLDHVREIYHVRYPGCGDRFNGKGVVYSSITGGYDFLNEPEVITPGVDYVLLADSNVEGYEGAWDIRLLENQQRYSPVRLLQPEKRKPIFVTRFVRICPISRVTREEQPSNMPLISVTLQESKPRRSRDRRERQPSNMELMSRQPGVWKAPAKSMATRFRYPAKSPRQDRPDRTPPSPQMVRVFIPSSRRT